MWCVILLVMGSASAFDQTAADPGVYESCVSSPMMAFCSSISEDYLASGFQTTCQPRGSGRRLSSWSTKMDMDELVALLHTLEAGRWTFPGMIYQARGIHFHYLLKESPLSRLAPILELLAVPLFPLYHHQLLFPLRVNGTVPIPVQKNLGWLHLEQNPSHLVIHLVRSGIEGRLISSPPKGYDFQYMGKIKPSWILATLGTLGNPRFSSVSWHCQHFAVRLFQDVARECTADQMTICPPLNANEVFPAEILPALCLVCQISGMLGLFLGLATLAYKLLKNLKGRCAKRDTAEMLIGCGDEGTS